MCLGRNKIRSTRKIKDLRSALVSNLPEVKSSICKTKKLTTKTQ